MSNLSPWKSNQTVTSLFLPRNGHITHTTINILSLCAHGIPWYPPSGPETDGNVAMAQLDRIFSKFNRSS